MLLPQTNYPLALDHPRVWRTYLGGALLDKFHGVCPESGTDGHFPEEWIMSVVCARNVGREAFPEEGLSHLSQNPDVSLKQILESDPVGYLGAKHAAVYGAQPGVLVKLIDAAERLTIQVHPDRDAALRLFNSPFGKTECWHILGGRSVNGEPPCIYLGFREGVTLEHWRHLFQQQDIDGMLSCLHRFEVQTGDTILIEGGIPHAIGAGCFLVEIQEPTDYTIRVEKTTPSGFTVDDAMCHQGLGFDKMFDCFNMHALSREETRKKWFLTPQYDPCDGGSVTRLVDETSTKLFAMRELRTEGTLTIADDTFSGLYVLEGKGILQCNEEKREIRTAEQYFIPFGVEKIRLVADSNASLRVLQYFGPKI